MVIIFFLIQIVIILTSIVLLCFLYYFVVFLAQNSGVINSSSDEVMDAFYYKDIEKVKNKEKHKIATIKCDCIPQKTSQRYKSMGYVDCRTQNMVFNGHLVCESGCLGFGSCAKLCPRDAILLNKGKIQITNVCDGCGLCIPACPKGLIFLVSENEQSDYVCAAIKNKTSQTVCPVLLERTHQK